MALADSDGGTRGPFVGRPEDRLHGSLRHPLVGEPTCAAEMHSILALNRAGAPTPEPAYDEQRRIGGHWRTLLVTEQPARCRPLDAWTCDCPEQGRGHVRAQRGAASAAAADAVRRLRRQRLVHNALHPQHLFVHIKPGGRAGLRSIVPEQMRRAGSRRRAWRRDLESSNRRTLCSSRSERMRLLMRYVGVRSAAPVLRLHWRYRARRFLDREGQGVNDC